MRLEKLLAVFLFLTPSIAFSQTNSNCDFTLEGYAYDRNTELPLPFVSIQVVNTNIGTTTNEEGFFKIGGLCKKEYDLLFSYVGYKTLEHHHDFHHSAVQVYLAPEEFLLESIIIEAEQAESGLSSISNTKLEQAALERMATQSLGDIASTISGISTISTGQNVVKPVIHGLHSNRILIVNEGLRHEFQNWGTDHAPEIDPSIIDELEVIKGAATVRYGPDALGGVLLIKAPRLELSTPFKGELNVVGKSNGQSGESTLKLQKGFKWWSVMGAGSLLKQGDLHTPDYQLTNTGKEELSYSGGIRIHPIAELDIEVYYSHFEQELGILRGSVNGNLDDLLKALNSEIPNFTEPFSYDINTPKQGVQHDLYKAKATWTGQQQSFWIQYGRQINKRKEFDVRKGNDLEIPNIDLELKTESIDAEWIHTAWNERMSGRLGVQWSEQANDNLPGTNTVPFIPNYDQTRYGVYLIEAVNWDEHLLEAGIRYDYQYAEIVGRQANNNIYRNQLDFQNVTATLGYRHNINQSTTFRTNIGTAWRPPNVAELYRFGRHVSFLEYGFWRHTINEEKDLISTKDILTEEDKPVPSEVGYKWINTYNIKKKDFQLEVTGYVNYIENFINARPAGLTRTVRGTSPFFIYEQSNALIWGIDAATQWQHHKQFNSTFKTSYIWAKDIEDDDFFIGMPPIAMNYQLDFTPTISFFDQTRLSIMTQYTFEQYQHPRILTVDEVINAFRTDIELFANNAKNFDIAAPPKGYFLMNLLWQGKWKHLKWQVQVHNLFNVSYRNYTNRLRYYADELGRNFMVMVGYEW